MHVAVHASVSIDETSLSSADMLNKHAIKQSQINVSIDETIRKSTNSIDETILSSAYMLLQHAVEQTQTKDENTVQTRRRRRMGQALKPSVQKQSKTTTGHLHHHL
jgi:hypothetical protein